MLSNTVDCHSLLMPLLPPKMLIERRVISTTLPLCMVTCLKSYCMVRSRRWGCFYPWIYIPVMVCIAELVCRRLARWGLLFCRVLINMLSTSLGRTKVVDTTTNSPVYPTLEPGLKSRVASCYFPTENWIRVVGPFGINLYYSAGEQQM